MKSPVKSSKDKNPQTKNRYESLAFFSDFGYADEFVGVVKSVIYSIAPFAEITDITHGIPRHNIRAGALALARSAPYLRPGVVLAVVDPGVGSTRRAIAVEVGDGQSVLVGPDNGILAPTVATIGGPSRVVELTNTDYHLTSPGKSFAARDIFAPAVAHIMKGVDLLELGEAVDPSSAVPQIIPAAPAIQNSQTTATVLWVDNFGNIQLNLSEEDINTLAGKSDTPKSQPVKFQLRFNTEVRTLKLADTYQNLEPGELGIMIDSYGLAAVVAPKASAAGQLQIKEGDEVELKRITEIK